MNVYAMNECDWVCANSGPEALEVYKKYVSDCHGMGTDDFNEYYADAEAGLVPDDALDKLTYVDDEYPPSKHSFRVELALRKKPEFFASTEY